MEQQIPDGDEETTGVGTNSSGGDPDSRNGGRGGDGGDYTTNRVEQDTTSLEEPPLVDEEQQQEEENSSPSPSSKVSDNRDISSDPPTPSASASRPTEGRTQESAVNEKIRSSSYAASTSTVSDGDGEGSFVAVLPGACAVAGPGISTMATAQVGAAPATAAARSSKVVAAAAASREASIDNRSNNNTVDPNGDNDQQKAKQPASNPTVAIGLPVDPPQTSRSTSTDQRERDSSTRDMDDNLSNDNYNNTSNDVESGVQEIDVGDENGDAVAADDGNTAADTADTSSQRNRDDRRDVPPENHPPSSTLPVAAAVHNDDDVLLISAELVLPLTTATPQHHHQQQQQQAVHATTPGHAGSVDMYHVDIDGDRSQAFHPTDQQQISDNRGYDIEETSRSESDVGSKDCNTNRRCQWIAFGVGVFLTVIGVIIAVVFSVTMGRDETTTTSTSTSTATTTADGAVNNPSDTFPYRCFSSTLDILSYQIDAPEDEGMNDDNPIIICPNTFIRVGNFKNPSADDFSITEGDYPIYMMRPNVTIQCGLDGKRSNNCTIAGGLIQVLTMYEYIHPDYGNLSPPPVLDGLTLRGLTFSGVIEGRFVYGGIPVTMSHPGKGNRFEDCAWVNLTASKRMMAVGQNYIMELRNVSIPELSVDLTVSNCLFENNLYEEEFFVVFGQSLHLENTTFRNNRLPSILTPGCGFHPNGCRNLIHARDGRNECSLKNVCMENFQMMGAGPIAISSTSTWSSSGINPWYGPVESDRDNLVDETQERPFCELGVAVFDDDEQSYICLNETVFEYQETGGCP